jgi:transposase
MSDQVKTIPPIPRETARLARATFGRTNFYILTGEYLETLFAGLEPKSLSKTGMVLPLVTFFQFLEGLTDAQAYDAVRTRLEWKFALHLPVYPLLFHENALCEFRQNVLVDPVCQLEFQALVDRLAVFNPPGYQPGQSQKTFEQVSAICTVNRLGLKYAAFGEALAALAWQYPLWLRENALPHWYGRYNQAFSNAGSLSSHNHPEISFQQIGADIQHLLERVQQTGPQALHNLPEVKSLERIWAQRTAKCQSGQFSNEFLKLPPCDLCIYRERKSPAELHQ